MVVCRANSPHKCSWRGMTTYPKQRGYIGSKADCDINTRRYRAHVMDTFQWVWVSASCTEHRVFIRLWQWTNLKIADVIGCLEANTEATLSLAILVHHESRTYGQIREQLKDSLNMSWNVRSQWDTSRHRKSNFAYMLWMRPVVWPGLPHVSKQPKFFAGSLHRRKRRKGVCYRLHHALNTSVHHRAVLAINSSVWRLTLPTSFSIMSGGNAGSSCCALAARQSNWIFWRAQVSSALYLRPRPQSFYRLDRVFRNVPSSSSPQCGSGCRSFQCLGYIRVWFVYAASMSRDRPDGCVWSHWPSSDVKGDPQQAEKDQWSDGHHPVWSRIEKPGVWIYRHEMCNQYI